MGAATAIGKGLIVLSFVVVVYISLTAYEIENITGLLRRRVILQNEPTHSSCVHPPIDVRPPDDKKQQQQLQSFHDENLTVISRDFFLYLASQLRDTPYPGVRNYTQYIVAKSRLNPLPGVEPLQPDYGPVLNDVTSFRYPIEIEKCRRQDVEHRSRNNVTSLFVAIISAPDYFDKRSIIRETWLGHLQKQSDLGLLHLAGFGFIVGLPQDQETQKMIEEENAVHNDILQIEMRDDYYNLTLKVVGLLNWINDRCSRVDFVFKVDDDVYVNVRNLKEVLKNLNSSEPSVYGSVVYNPPQRGGKWEVSLEDWPWSNYPSYFRGAAVLLPGRTISSLFAAAQTTPYFPFDDVYLTGLCTAKAGIKVRHSDRFFLGGATDTPEPCHVRTSITWLTDSVSHIEKSHLAFQNFYNNVTQCLVTRPDGMNQTAVPEETIDFFFSN